MEEWKLIIKEAEDLFQLKQEIALLVFPGGREGHPSNEQIVIYFYAVLVGRSGGGITFYKAKGTNSNKGRKQGGICLNLFN